MNLPENFVCEMRSLLGEERFSRLSQALMSSPEVSIRLNHSKCGESTVEGEPVAWCEEGYYLNERPAFTFDPLLHAGYYYVQEASSMFLHRVLKQYVSGPVILLDLCAAPGGKTTTALGALPEGSIVMCNEPIRPRAKVLAENLMKWGNPRVMVTNNYPADYAKSGLLFDVVVCDVPCSGEGMFRKDEEARNGWSEELVANCSRLQREIVAEAWNCLKKGGYLVYSTCTFNLHEDEENVAWIREELGGEVLPVDIDDRWGITSSLKSDELSLPVYRFLPGFTRGEGLFMAVIRKEGGDKQQEMTAGKTEKKGKERKKPMREDRGGTENLWVNPTDSYLFTSLPATGERVALPHDLVPYYKIAEKQLRILTAGVMLGETKGKEMLPHAALALSTAFRRTAFPEVELSYSEAISFLRGETLSLKEGVARGMVTVTYLGAPLGFVKNIGNRANNLYPREWRIKSTHLPDEAPQVCIEK